MSMCLYLKHASEIDLARFARDGVDEDDLETPFENFNDMGAPDATGLQELARWLETQRPQAPNDPDAAQMEFARQIVAAQLTPLAGLPPHEEKSETQPARSKAPVLDLHKSWHMLHYLFTGQAWDGEMPASALLLGGQEVGEDLGYGPARALSPAETAGFSDFLKALKVEQLAERLDMDAMRRAEIYCAEHVDPDAAAELEEDLEHYFPQLQSFVADAAAKRQGLLIYMM